MNRLEALRQNRLLQGCHEDVLAQIAPLVAVVDAPAGTVIFRRGEPADAMYLVLAGTVNLMRDAAGVDGGSEMLAAVHASDFFGDMALLDHLPHVVQAVAAEACLLGRIDQHNTEEILRLAPHVVPLNFVRAVHRRVTGANVHFTEEILRDGRLHHVGAMAGAIIHDFNTPLTTIRCACDLLETRAHDAMHRRMAEVIKQSVERMLAMMQELLDYTLGGNAPLRIEPIPVARLLAGLDEQVLDDLPRHGVQVERQIAYDGEVSIDLGRFERVLLNIIKNAKEAMGKRGGLLRLTVYPSGEWLVFEIEDTGKGMPPEVAAKIFEPFFTHDKPKGTGLGMAMAKTVVDAHHGAIRVESQPGHGTKFEVKIPLPPKSQQTR